MADRFIRMTVITCLAKELMNISGDRRVLGQVEGGVGRRVGPVRLVELRGDGTGDEDRDDPEKLLLHWPPCGWSAAGGYDKLPNKSTNGSIPEVVREPQPRDQGEALIDAFPSAHRIEEAQVGRKPLAEESDAEREDHHIRPEGDVVF